MHDYRNHRNVNERAAASSLCPIYEMHRSYRFIIFEQLTYIVYANKIDSFVAGMIEIIPYFFDILLYVSFILRRNFIVKFHYICFLIQ